MGSQELCPIGDNNYNKPMLPFLPMLPMLLKLFLIGIIILVGAILINALAALLNLATWYSFLSTLARDGLLPGLKNTPILSLIFLFLLYPFSLGCLAYLGLRITGLLSNVN
jgi:hypothetical protein